MGPTLREEITVELVLEWLTEFEENAQALARIHYESDKNDLANFLVIKIADLEFKPVKI